MHYHLGKDTEKLKATKPVRDRQKPPAGKKKIVESCQDVVCSKCILFIIISAKMLENVLLFLVKVLLLQIARSRGLADSLSNAFSDVMTCVLLNDS